MCIDGSLAPRLAGLGSRFRIPSSGTWPATRSADKRCEATAATKQSYFVRRDSTDQNLVVIHSPRQWLAARSGCGCACAPTDADVATEPVDRVIPCWAARSPENGFLPAASESTLRRAGHVSACGAPPLESWQDDRLGIQFPVPPSSTETNALIRWLLCLPAPDLEAESKTPARRCLRASAFDLLPRRL